LGEVVERQSVGGHHDDDGEVHLIRVEVHGVVVASTALNKHKGLQQFFKWLLIDEQAIDRNPMDRVRQPKTPTKLVPVMREADTAKVLNCRGRGFAQPAR